MKQYDVWNAFRDAPRNFSRDAVAAAHDILDERVDDFFIHRLVQTSLGDSEPFAQTIDVQKTFVTKLVEEKLASTRRVVHEHRIDDPCVHHRFSI